VVHPLAEPPAALYTTRLADVVYFSVRDFYVASNTLLVIIYEIF
jgi:hypothetical protein